MPEKHNTESKLSKQLKQIYYDSQNPGSYGGINRLQKAARAKGIKVTHDQVAKFLRDQASYSLHKPARKNFSRNPTIVGGIDQQWQADLADMQAIAKENRGFRYLLTVIDVFSKFAWVIPVKNKGSAEMVAAFKSLIKNSNPRFPAKIQTDAGKEFLNSDLQKYLKSRKIEHFVTTSDKKAAVVERFNRTLKSRIWTYFTAHQTQKYIDKLADFVKSYNHSWHRSIGMRPADVKNRDQDRIWHRLYGRYVSISKSKIKPGQKVRISKVKGIFEKGYIPNWSEEHFHVRKQMGRNKSVYTLKDDANEDIKGQFYEEELQPITENRYLVDKILKKRKLPSGKFEYFIKWKGWPSKFNSWIPEENFEEVSK